MTASTVDAEAVAPDVLAAIRFAYRKRETLQTSQVGRYLVALAAAYIREHGDPRHG